MTGMPKASAAPRMSVKAVYGTDQSFSFRCRQRRFAIVRDMIETIVAETGRCRILDVGGSEYYWRVAGDLFETAPVTVDLVNIEPSEASAPWCRSLLGDATRLDDVHSGDYDLVHSNSVIEHVGNWSNMHAMAEQIRRIAPAYYVQTPYFWFPIEPHFRAPVFHWLPEQVRYRLLMRFNLGFGGRRRSLDDAMRGLQSSNMLDKTQFKALFPDAEIRHERICGLTKSLMAVRTGHQKN